MQGPTVLMRYYEMAHGIWNSIGYGIGGPHCRPPAPFGREFVAILSPYDYCDQFGEIGWLIAPGPMCPKAAEEDDLHRLPVCVEFGRQLDRDTATRFAVHLAQWLTEVRESGVFGEGPVFCPEPCLRLAKYCGKFLLDFSNSGPRTYSWFCLSCLDFGIKVSPIRGVFFAGVESSPRATLPTTNSVPIVVPANP